LQQIGQDNNSDLTNIVVTPKHLEKQTLKARKKTNPIIAQANNFWVLHKKLLIRVILALLVFILLAATFNYRAEIGKGFKAISSTFSGEFAQLGFAIDEISITGQDLTNESDVVKALEINEASSTISFNSNEARERLLQLPSVKSATIRKIYPSQIVINLIEKKPVARWRVAGKTYVIDAKGDRLAIAVDGVDDGLMLVIGVGAEKNANVIVQTIKRYSSINEGLVALSKIADRRWDLLYNNGLRVQLPEFGVAKALAKLVEYQKEYSLLDRDVSLIDLRLEDELVVRLIKREEEISVKETN